MPGQFFCYAVHRAGHFQIGDKGMTQAMKADAGHVTFRGAAFAHANLCAGRTRFNQAARGHDVVKAL